MMFFRDARELFPACKRLIYLDVAARAILCEPVRAAIDGLLDELRESGGDRDDWIRVAGEARARYATLIGAHPAEIAWTKNVSEGINIFANALHWRPGDNVILTLDHEHPNSAYAWYNLQRLGVETRIVHSTDGIVRVDALEQAMDDRTRVISVCAVSFSPGYRVDLPALSTVCRQRGALLFVDGAQSVGTLHTDVGAQGIDGLATTIHKGLLGLYGTGLLYVRREIIESMEPVYLSRSSVEAMTTEEFAGPPSEYRLAPGAQRFEIGNLNYLGAHAANAALELLLAVDTQRIESHVLDLSRRLSEGLADIGLKVLGPVAGPGLSSIVCATVSRPDATTVVQRIYDYLMKNDVRLSIRRGSLRFSFHLFNNESDVDATLEHLRKFFGTL